MIVYIFPRTLEEIVQGRKIPIRFNLCPKLKKSRAKNNMEQHKYLLALHRNESYEKVIMLTSKEKDIDELICE
jgi:hypothetical protein